MDTGGFSTAHLAAGLLPPSGLSLQQVQGDMPSDVGNIEELKMKELKK